MKRIRQVFTYTILAFNLFFVGMLILTAYSPYLHPVEYPLASTFGLTFPIFLVINFAFFVFWITANYRWALLPLLAFAVCFPQIQTYLPIHSKTALLPHGCIKVLSYNIMGFNGLNKENGRNAILDYITESDADIICLQEYYNSKDSKHLTAKDISNALSAYPYHDLQKIGTKGGGNQIAIFSKFPILSAYKVDYKSDYNGSAVYELKTDSDTLLVINNHLESNKITKLDKVVYEEMLQKPRAEKVKSGLKQLVRKLAEASAIRSKQAEMIADVIKKSTHQSIIVCGDFNDASISYTHRLLTEQLDDAFTKSGQGLGISYNQNKFYFRIDNILVSKNFETYNCTVDRSIKESDHYPIWCYIKKH